MRILHTGNPHVVYRFSSVPSPPLRGGNRRRPQRAFVPLHRLSRHCVRGAGGDKPSGEIVVTGAAHVFGEHRREIPYAPLADLLAGYRERHPDKPAIVDVDQEKSISFGALEAATTDIAAALKERGVAKGSRVLLLVEANVGQLLLWFGTWRLGALVAPLNVELNAAYIADLAATISPALTLVHKDLDGK